MEMKLNAFLNDVLRKATELTRKQNLVEATRLIQRALSGREQAAPEKPADQRGPVIDLKPESAPTPAAERATRPLGDVVKTLHQSEIAKFARGVAQHLPQGLTAPLGKLRPSPMVEAPAGASYQTRTFACEAGTRDYALYLPSRMASPHPALVVMLHGCTQDADDFALGTGMNRLAEEQGFIVAYPKQTAKANRMTCWNWFEPGDQTRDRGEPRIIAGITREIIAEYDVDPKLVFIAGLSAGGAMAEILGFAYPELYAATGVHSGLAYGAAGDMASAFAAMSGGGKNEIKGRKAGVRTIVFHGAADRTVHPSNGQAILEGARVALAGACEESRSEGSAGGRAYTRTRIVDAQGVAHVEHWAIEGLGHAWSGGSPEGTYTDKQGPDASREMLRFFLGQAADPAIN
jgi:poly(hydroxyalkanoate) depolymerase family esterase